MLLALVAIITILVYLYLTKKVKKVPFKNNFKEDELEILELTTTEKEGNILTTPAISSITLYQGDITSKFSLSDQVLMILKANPWLAGRLVYHQFSGRKKKEIVLKYPRNFPDTKLKDHYFEKWISSTEFHEKLAFDRLWEITSPFLCKSGKDSTDNDEILFKIIIFKIYDANNNESQSNRKVIRTALVCSMSHVIGDGHTFYHVYGFLDGHAPVESLIIKRDTSYPSCVNKERGEFYEKGLKSWKLKAAIIIRRLFFAKPVFVKVFLVNQELLNEKKREYLNTIQQSTSPLSSTKTTSSSIGIHREKRNILSSNDILTSLFFNKLNVLYGLMAINFRGRKKEYTNNHAGNYQGPLIYSQEDYQSPFGIRQALLNNYSAPNTKFPENFHIFCKFEPTLITNWSSFYIHLKFPGMNSHIYHVPLMYNNTVICDTCVIFKKDPEQLALLTLIREKNIFQTFTESYLEEDFVLSPQL
jgi:hypothetical protein